MYQEIAEHYDGGRGCRPIIVQFQNGNLTKGSERKLKSGVFKHTKKKKTVAVASNKILYTGRLREDKGDPYNHFLLVHKKSTGTLKLVRVDNVLLQASLHKNTNVTSKQDKAMASNKLNKTFGSKRAKRIMEQRERLNMNVEAVREQLEETVAAVEINDTLPLTSHVSENASLYRPQIHRQAVRREEVYIVDEIVPMDVLYSLEEETTSILQDISASTVSPFVQNLLEKSSENIDMCELLLYLDYLIKFISVPAIKITKRFVLCESSTIANDHILDNYSINSNAGRKRPLSMKDKVLCSILVLSMITSDYELDIQALSKEIKVGLKKIQDVARVLAFSTGKVKNTMVLKVPLPAPVSTSPRKKK